MKKTTIISALLLNALFAFTQISYQYDNLNRLYQVNYPNGTSVVYTYDELGNRMSKTVSSSHIAVTGVNLDETTMGLLTGETGQLTAAVTPGNATNQQVNWSSSDESVATVANGIITAKSAGTATITATTQEGSFTATCTVTVSNMPSSDASLSSLTVSQGTLTPAFDPAITQYTVEVSNAVTGIDLSATANDAAATVSGTGTHTLNVGDNIFVVTVTAENGDTQNYTITVTRQTPPPAPISVTGVSLDRTNLSLIVGNAEQLNVTVTPGNATNQQVIWSSSDTLVATVLNGFVTATGVGTATITVTTQDGNFTATCNAEVNNQEDEAEIEEEAEDEVEIEVTVEVEETKVVGESGTGSITVSFTIPANTLFTGSFKLELPPGMRVDLPATHLVGNLASLLTLTVTENAAGSWLFTITPSMLRIGTEMVYTQIVEIVYTVDETVDTGQYEASISDLSFLFDNGTMIENDMLPVIITVTTPTHNMPVNVAIYAYTFNNRLYVQSPFAETVNVYSLSGVLLYNFEKSEGAVSYVIDKYRGMILIVRGSSGWVRKVN